MILLFGETLDNQEKEEISADQKLGQQAKENPRATAFVLMEKDNILSASEVAIISRKSAEEIRQALLTLI